MDDGKADIGLIGLAVMGQNLALNMNDHGFVVSVFNRTISEVDRFMEGPAKGTQVIGTRSIKEMIGALKKPRKIILMIKAGVPVDAVIKECVPLLDKGDILIDGGNSYFLDSERRYHELKERGLSFLGMGISGGEEGARHGPSIMPGGDKSAWETVRPIFQAIAAKAEEGEPCCDWVGEGGAGHYVKMVHNGIEYGDMQIICEAYHLLSAIFGCTAGELQKIFAKWNEGELNSYLIEITSHIFGHKEKDGTLLLDHILDVAGQKGTGKWAVGNALDLGVPLTLIGESVFARNLSALKEERIKMSERFPKKEKSFAKDKEKAIERVRHATYVSKIISYAQGFMLLKCISKEMKWNLDFGAIALLWRGGCIIRSRFLQKIKEAFAKNPELETLLLDPFFEKEIKEREEGWRKVVSLAVEHGIPIPCISSALSFFDGYRRDRLPANLLQAMRDYFGAHTYERVDEPRGTFFHTNWTGTGGDVTANSYTV